ncbi:MAG: hypothetical protein ACYCXU_00985 [Thermoleophilia bacterium]
MTKRIRLLAFFAAAALFAALAVFSAGCGSTTTTEAITVSPECAAAPSVIPKTQGRPMMVEFFIPT